MAGGEYRWHADSLPIRIAFQKEEGKRIGVQGRIGEKNRDPIPGLLSFYSGLN